MIVLHEPLLLSAPGKLESVANDLRDYLRTNAGKRNPPIGMTITVRLTDAAGASM